MSKSENTYTIDLKRYGRMRVNLHAIMCAVSAIGAVACYKFGHEVLCGLFALYAVTQVISALYPADIHLFINYDQKHEWHVFAVYFMDGTARYVMGRDPEDVANILAQQGVDNWVEMEKIDSNKWRLVKINPDEKDEENVKSNIS